MRSITGHAIDAGRLDGLTDGINTRLYDANGRWRQQQVAGRPASDYPAYRSGYVEGYVTGTRRSRAWRSR